MSLRRPGSKRYAALDRREWGLTRLRAFERDNWRCTGCGRVGKLEGHHVVELQDGGAAYDVENVRTVCRACHIAEHRRPVTAEEAAWRELIEELARPVNGALR